MKWFGANLSAENRTMMYVPRGFAHGFITLADHTEVLYFVSAAYAPDRERGLRWNDPELGIHWPREPSMISVKDESWHSFDPDHLGISQFEFR
jgi:dTDP-4-dehydrorhamnose 3,5-epimerase